MKFQFDLKKEDIKKNKLKRCMLNLDEQKHDLCMRIAKNKDTSISELHRHWEEQYANAYSHFA